MSILITGTGTCDIQMKKRPSNSHQSKILLVDDEPDVTLTLKKGLEENGFSVDAFNDPRVALSKFKASIL